MITDDGGNYAFAVAPGEYDLQAYGYPRGSAHRITGSSGRPSAGLTESRVFDIRLPLKRVDVHVQDLAGQPVANVSVLTSGMYSPIAIGSLGGWGTPRTTSGTCW